MSADEPNPPYERQGEGAVPRPRGGTSPAARGGTPPARRAEGVAVAAPKPTLRNVAERAGVSKSLV
jgi:hypothetical protein